MPTPILVYESEWKIYEFDKYSALKVVTDQSDKEGQPASHTYYINMDNIYLKTELKGTKHDPKIVKDRWTYGIILIGLALLRDTDALWASLFKRPSN